MPRNALHPLQPRRDKNGECETMNDIEEREQNLFNATDTLAQFYDEIESFMDLLFGCMERLGFSSKAERLRSGTFTIANLPRRLLASAMVMYVKGEGAVEDAADDNEPDDEPEEDGGEIAKTGKAEVMITPDLKIPFVSLFLFRPKLIPSVRTLESPRLLLGAVGNIRFIEKKTGQPANPESPSLAFSNLVQVPVNPVSKVGDELRVNCWSPKAMKRFKLVTDLIGFESVRLLEMDTQERIKAVADKLVAFCKP
jgi:hypothetical protein